MQNCYYDIITECKAILFTILQLSFCSSYHWKCAEFLVLSYRTNTSDVITGVLPYGQQDRPRPERFAERQVWYWDSPALHRPLLSWPHPWTCYSGELLVYGTVLTLCFLLSSSSVKVQRKKKNDSENLLRKLCITFIESPVKSSKQSCVPK